MCKRPERRPPLLSKSTPITKVTYISNPNRSKRASHSKSSTRKEHRNICLVEVHRRGAESDLVKKLLSISQSSQGLVQQGRSGTLVLPESEVRSSDSFALTEVTGPGIDVFDSLW